MNKYLAVIIVLITLTYCSNKDKEDILGGGHKENTYFKLTVNGVQKELENIHYARSGRDIHLATWGKNGFPNFK